MSDANTNMMIQVMASTAFESGALAWGASALSSPIGPIGGAIFGVVRYLSQIPLLILSTSYLNADDPQASSATKTAAQALMFFGSYAVAWGVLATAGLSITLFHVVSLSIVSIVAAFSMRVFLRYMGIIPTENSEQKV